MTDPLTKDDIKKELETLSEWEFGDNKIKREYGFNDFSEALGFIVRVGLEAEKQGHHPELFNVYNTVKIALSTHDADDKVTQKDIDLARAIEDLV
ncbi:MAG: 4a-hydroxytetrahydrobiopterin dehydratase [Gracilimonas sp.]|nr:4a-hydroxytetrahydrobiopterin dehydratase [Gracilimonas sp.]